MDPQMAKTFRLIPYGIYVLTARKGAEPCAMIVSWVSQVSYSPPLLMVALRRHRHALPIIRESGVFALSLLRVEQKPMVVFLKNPISQRKFSELFVATEENGVPFLKEALASWECRVFTTMEAGDHILFIGEVRWASASQQGKPLTTADYGKTYIGES
ncbi:MAG: flavin reductase family protein [Deltaproteobacteria bacterium]|nr:flavin reductase family protein [Deltaproteobacteria bacterium]